MASPYDSARYASLRDRTVLVTGGASGIGAEIVAAFAAQGARVAFLDVAAEAGERTAERALGGQPAWSPPEGLPDIYIAMGQTAENVRELENVIHHTLLIGRDGLIRADDLHLSNLRLERGEELARGGPASGAAEHLLQQAFQRLFEEQGENLHGRVEDALLRAALALAVARLATG